MWPYKQARQTCIYVTRAGKMSQKSHGLILSYRQKKFKMSVLVEFEVFTKMSSLSPLLAIPMLQIVIKHLKWSLFVRFLRGVPFSLLASGRLLLILTTSCRSIVAKRSIPDLWIFISNSPVQTSEILFLNPCWWKKSDRADWHLQSACIRRAFPRARNLPYKEHYCEICLGEIHIMCHNLLCLTWTFS